MAMEAYGYISWKAVQHCKSIDNLMRKMKELAKDSDLYISRFFIEKDDSKSEHERLSSLVRSGGVNDIIYNDIGDAEIYGYEIKTGKWDSCIITAYHLNNGFKKAVGYFPAFKEIDHAIGEQFLIEKARQKGYEIIKMFHWDDYFREIVEGIKRKNELLDISKDELEHRIDTAIDFAHDVVRDQMYQSKLLEFWLADEQNQFEAIFTLKDEVSEDATPLIRYYILPYRNDLTEKMYDDVVGEYNWDMSPRLSDPDDSMIIFKPDGQQLNEGIITEFFYTTKSNL